MYWGGFSWSILHIDFVYSLNLSDGEEIQRTRILTFNKMKKETREIDFIETIIDMRNDEMLYAYNNADEVISVTAPESAVANLGR